MPARHAVTLPVGSNIDLTQDTHLPYELAHHLEFGMEVAALPRSLLVPPSLSLMMLSPWLGRWVGGLDEEVYTPY